jgi:LTXXQ motif family protein
MRPWAIPLAGAVAFSVLFSPASDARPRFGPAAVLGAMTAPLGLVFGGVHPRFSRHHARSESARADAPGNAEPARAEPVAPQPVAPVQLIANARPDPAAVYWPFAADDLIEYVFFPRGNDDRFWSYGYGAILYGAFAATDTDTGRRSRAISAAANTRIAATDGKAAEFSADPCGSGRTQTTADGVVERISQAIAPSASQRELLRELRTALTRAIDRIKAACPAITTATPALRLKAIEDRIGALRDALLTLHVPFERLSGSLSDEQLWRLQRDGTSADNMVAITGSVERRADERRESCVDQAAGMAEWPMRAIDRALRPTEQQRAALDGLRMRLMGMGQLVASSCPTYPLLGATGRIAAAGDRLNVMLFTVVTLGPTLVEFYDSLSDKQKAALARVIRHYQRSAQSND